MCLRIPVLSSTRAYSIVYHLTLSNVIKLYEHILIIIEEQYKNNVIYIDQHKNLED